MYTNVVKTLFEEFKGRTVAEITLQGGRGGSAAVATLGISFLESDDEHITDVNLNFRRYHPGRIDFEEIGSEGHCLNNWKSVDGKETSCCFEQTMYETLTGYFELLTVSDLSVGKRFAFHHAKIDLDSYKDGTRHYDEARIMMAFTEVTENQKEDPDHFVCFHIPLDHETNVNFRAKTLLVPHIENMRKGNVFANSKDFELYFTEEDEEDFVEAERETRPSRVDTALEQWLSAKPNRNEAMICTKSGKTYSANDLLTAIRLQTEVGIKLQNDIISLTIDLLFRGEEHI